MQNNNMNSYMNSNFVQIRFKCGHVENIDISRTKLKPVLIRKMEHDYCTACWNKLEDQKYAVGYNLERMFYGRYKEEFPDCHMRHGSYNPVDCTVEVYVPI